MTKKNSKTAAKTKKPAFVVNVNDIEYLEDVDVVFGLAKQDAGLPISDDELIAICLFTWKHMGPRFIIVECKCGKKTPWYKRFWNWVTKPFKKNK